MTIQLIAMDMDGTLLRKDNTISLETKKMLLKVQKQGIRIALASGRSYSKLMDYAKELDMERYGGYLIEVNGMAIYDLKNQKRYIDGRMPKEDAQQIFHYFSQWQVEIIGNLDTGMYDYNPPTILEEKLRYRKEHHLGDEFPLTGGAFDFITDNRKGYPDIRYIQCAEDIQEDVNKISVTYWPEVMQRVSEQAKIDLASMYWVGLTSDKWLEIMMSQVTKAYGLEKLGKLTGIAMDEIMAFGDGENDVEMLKAAGLGIAMGNAMENVKASADASTDTNMEDGIAKAIQRYITF